MLRDWTPRCGFGVWGSGAHWGGGLVGGVGVCMLGPEDPLLRDLGGLRGGKGNTTGV